MPSINREQLGVIMDSLAENPLLWCGINWSLT